MRRGLLALSAVGVVGTAIELAMLRHWGSSAQLVPWFALLFAGLTVVSSRSDPLR